MAASYTARQGQFLAFIHLYTKLHRQPPSEAEMAAYFRVSPPSVHQMVVTLENRGLIERVPGQARSIRLLLPTDELPDLESGMPLAGSAASFSFAAVYPHITDWVIEHGWIEIGQDDFSRSMVRALDIGGMIWEGQSRYESIDQLLQDLETNLARWMAENL